jgi:hypothetical protein
MMAMQEDSPFEAPLLLLAPLLISRHCSSANWSGVRTREVCSQVGVRTAAVPADSRRKTGRQRQSEVPHSRLARASRRHKMAETSHTLDSQNVYQIYKSPPPPLAFHVRQLDKN